MMLISIIRFWAYGWIEKFYIEPKFFFSFYGFDWIEPLGGFKKGKLANISNLTTFPSFFCTLFLLNFSLIFLYPFAFL